MKTKTISRVILTKFNQWVASIDDETLRNRICKGTVVTGGCIASMLLREPVNDFDLYFTTKELAADVARYYVEQFKANPPETFKGEGKDVDIYVKDDDDRVKIVIQSAGIASEKKTSSYEYFEAQPDEVGDEYVEQVTQALNHADDIEAAAMDEQKPKYRPVFLTANAITLSDKIQIVIRFYGKPEEIHETYDFVHCTNYWTPEGGLVLNQEALAALLTKELRYVGSRYPLCSVIRTRKFTGRGWTINAGQYLKMCFQLSQLDLTSVSVLEDQLIGVDSAYFLQLVERLKEQDPEKVNATYLTSIIDRIF